MQWTFEVEEGYRERIWRSAADRTALHQEIFPNIYGIFAHFGSSMPSLSLYAHEDDATFWAEHAYVRLRPATRLPAEAEDIVLGDRIWFGSVASQDDIFEGAPHFVADPNSLDLETITRLVARNMVGASSSDVDAFASRMFADLSDPAIFAERIGLMIERYGQLFRGSSILSLFRSPTVQRNWSDYASRGAGYGAVFDFRVPWPLEGAKGIIVPAVPFPVEYVPADDPPVIRVRAAPVYGGEGFEDIKVAMLTKSDEWESQGEERLFRVGVGPGHVEFPAASLRAMLVGYAMTEEAEKHMLELCRSRSVPIPVFRVEPNPPSRRLSMRQVI